MMDKPLKKCPKCKKSKLRRLIGTGAAIIFKGSGFYQTDYRSESYKSAAKAEETKPSSTDGEASKSKSDAKSADQSASAGAKDTSSTSSPAKKPKS